MSSNVRLSTAVADCTQPFDRLGTRLSYEYFEELLGDRSSCDEAYLAVAYRAKSSLDQQEVLGKCFALLRQYLLRYPPSERTASALAECCQEALAHVEAAGKELQECILYAQSLLDSLHASARMGQKTSKASAASDDAKRGAKDKRRQGGKSVTLPHGVPNVRDSPFADASPGGRIRDGPGHHHPQSASHLSTPKLSEQLTEQLTEALPSDGPGQPHLSNLFRLRWQTGKVSVERETKWLASLPQVTTQLYSSGRVASEAHESAPKWWTTKETLGGDHGCAQDTSVRVELHEEGKAHLRSIVQMQMGLHHRNEDGTVSSPSSTANTNQGQFLPGHRPLFSYKRYEDQEPLAMTRVETAAAVGLVLGPGAVEGLLGPDFEDLADPNLVAESPPAARHAQIGKMASIVIKLVMDMWLSSPDTESLPLVLSMLQAALRQPSVGYRTRVFDIVYNLSLHACMIASDDEEAQDSGSPLRGSPDASLSAKLVRFDSTKRSLFRLPMPPGAEARRMTKTMHFLQWLRCMAFQLLLDLAHIAETSEEVWRAALGCLLHLVSERGTIMMHLLAGLSAKPVRCMLHVATRCAWSLELQSMLMNTACHLCYIHTQNDVDQESRNPMHQYQSEPLNLATVDALGGAEQLLAWLRRAPTVIARENLLAVLLDLALVRACTDDASQAAYCGSRNFVRLKALLSSPCVANLLSLSLSCVGPAAALAEVVSAVSRETSKLPDGTLPHLVEASSGLIKLLQALGSLDSSSSEWDETAQVLEDASCSHQQEDRAGTEQVLAAMLQSREPITRARAAELLSRIIWRVRAPEVRAAAASILQPGKGRPLDAAALAPVALLPSPAAPYADASATADMLGPLLASLQQHLHDPALSAAAADTVLAITRRLVATALLRRLELHSLAPNATRPTAQHALVISATLASAAEWLSEAHLSVHKPRMLELVQILLEVLTVPAGDTATEDAARGGGGILRVGGSPRAGTEAAASERSLHSSSITLLLQGRCKVPSFIVAALPTPFLLSLRDALTSCASQAFSSALDNPGFDGWCFVDGVLKPSKHGPESTTNQPGAARRFDGLVAQGLSLGLSSTIDARLVVLLVLLWKCRMDSSAFALTGGTAALKTALRDEDARVRFVAADFILERASTHKAHELRMATQKLLEHAQNSKNPTYIENPYAQVEAFLAHGLLSVDDL